MWKWNDGTELYHSNYLMHYGKGHDDNPPGRGSGRYPWGSGKENRITKKYRKVKKKIQDANLLGPAKQAIIDMKVVKKDKETEQFKKISSKIFGRDKELNVSYNLYSGEEISKSQMRAANAIKKIDFNDKKILKKLHDFISYRYNDEMFPGDESTINNPFKYINPRGWYIMARPTDTSQGRVALVCDFRFNPEDAIFIVFDSNGNLNDIDYDYAFL